MSNITTRIWNNHSIKQLFLFGMIGILSNLAGYLIYLLITQFGIEPKVAMTILYIFGVSLNYHGNRKWTFAQDNQSLGARSRFILAHIIGYMINFTLLVIFVDVLGYNHKITQAVAILIVAGYLFIALKYFVFSNIVKSKRDDI